VPWSFVNILCLPGAQRFRGDDLLTFLVDENERGARSLFVTFAVDQKALAERCGDQLR
jgi:hypothetical protein